MGASAGRVAARTIARGIFDESPGDFKLETPANGLWLSDDDPRY